MTETRLMHVEDDEESVRKSASFLLRTSGFETCSYPSGVAFLKDVKHAAPGCILLDLRMTKPDGFDVMEELKRREIDWPIIVMTGWGSIETAVEAMRRGARTFVHKPWENASLTETVTRELDEARTRREADEFASRELEHAQRIQRALLPSPLPAVDGCEMAALWKPAAAFGGDCYDVLRFSNTRLGLSIADVAGA